MYGYGLKPVMAIKSLIPAAELRVDRYKSLLLLPVVKANA
jgi:hypothetical protein